MPEAWRIVRPRHAGGAFTGEGAWRHGGRWNPPGMRVVYCSSAKSLATLETLVHLNPLILFRYIIFRIQFSDELVEKLPLRSLPKNWRAQPPPRSTKRLGERWVREGSSAVLAVPSVIIPGELNYLLNPAHADFRKLKIGKPTPFVFDPQLLR